MPPFTLESDIVLLQCKNYLKLRVIITAQASVLVAVSLSFANDVPN